MAGIIFFVLIIISISFLLINIGIKCEYTITLTLSGIAIFIFIMGMFGLLELSVILVMIFAVFSLIYVFGIKRKNNCHRYEYIWILAVVGIITLFVTAITYANVMWTGDDLYHWGLVTKNMYYFDAFCLDNPVSITYTTYSEFTGVLPYFVLKMNGGYEDWIIFAVMDMYCISMLIPFLKMEKSRYSILRSIGCLESIVHS